MQKWRHRRGACRRAWLGVSVATIGRWQAKHPGFAAALRVGKGEYDDRIERALAQRAIGYSYDAVKIFLPAGSNEPVYVPYREHIPPDPIAAFKWLSCRRMHEWRDRRELTGADGSPLAPIIELLGEINGRTVSLIDARTFNVRDIRTNGKSEGPKGISSIESGISQTADEIYRHHVGTASKKGAENASPRDGWDQPPRRHG